MTNKLDTPELSSAEKLDGCIRQAELGASRWDKRRSAEWKVTLGMWAGVLTAGKFVAEKNWNIPLWILAIVGTLLLLAYIVLWLRGLWAANNSDKVWEFHYRREAAMLLSAKDHQVQHPPERTKPNWKFVTNDWSMQFQIVFTAMLVAISVLLIAMSGHATAAPSPPQPIDAPASGTDLGKWDHVAQIAMAATSFITVIIAILLARYTVSQLKEMRKQTNASSVFELLKYIQSENLQDARRHVLVSLKEKQFADWDDEDKKMASNVAASYDVMGRVIKEGLVQIEFFLPPAASSICRSYEIISPLISEISENSGQDYWPEFMWLKEEAIRRQWYHPEQTEGVPQ